MPPTCTFHSPPSSPTAALEDVALQPQALGALKLRGFFLPACQSTAAARALGALLARVPLLLVDLKNAHLTDESVAALAAGLADAPCLQALQLSRTESSWCTVRTCMLHPHKSSGKHFPAFICALSTHSCPTRACVHLR